MATTQKPLLQGSASIEMHKQSRQVIAHKVTNNSIESCLYKALSLETTYLTQRSSQRSCVLLSLPLD